MVHPDVRLSISWTGQMLPYLSLYGYINVWLFIVHYHTWAEIPWAYITVTLHHLPQFVNIYLHKEIEWGTSVNKVNFWDKLIEKPGTSEIAPMIATADFPAIFLFSAFDNWQTFSGTFSHLETPLMVSTPRCALILLPDSTQNCFWH